MTDLCYSLIIIRQKNTSLINAIYSVEIVLTWTSKKNTAMFFKSILSPQSGNMTHYVIVLSVKSNFKHFESNGCYLCYTVN